MKKLIIKSLIYTFALIFTVSCGSTPKEVEKAQTEEIKTEKSDKSSGKRTLKVINTQSPARVEETPQSLYIKKTQGIKLSLVSNPKETTAGKSFTLPFIFKAENSDGTAAEGLELTVNFPEAKSEGKTVFGIATLTTDTEGKITFMPATPQTSFDSQISVYPSGDVSIPEIAETASKLSLTIPYKVKTNLTLAGGTIALVDFNSNNKPITNNSVSSSNLLMSLMKLGFKRIGNADFTNSILKDDKDTVFKAAKSLLGNNSAFLVYGTVKYASQIKQTDDSKYHLTLNGKITCLNMKDGSILFEKEREVSVTEDKEWNCLPKARSELASMFAQDINYGL